MEVWWRGVWKFIPLTLMKFWFCVDSHNTHLSIYSYPIHKSKCDLLIHAILLQYQQFLTISVGNPQKGLLKCMAWFYMHLKLDTQTSLPSGFLLFCWNSFCACEFFYPTHVCRLKARLLCFQSDLSMLHGIRCTFLPFLTYFCHFIFPGFPFMLILYW